MTRRARVVLDDCRGALLELIDGLQGAQWRRRYITCIVLLRAVGHILDKVDGDACIAMRVAVKDAYKELKGTKPKPEIYWEFIEPERNLILKEYEHAAGQGVRAKGGPATYDERGNLVESELGTIEYVYGIMSGPFEGRRQHELIQEAIDWWQDYLDKIDQLVNTVAPP